MGVGGGGLGGGGIRLRNGAPVVHPYGTYTWNE